MPINEEAKHFAEHVVDLLQNIGPVYSKRMFGGFGVFLDGLMFGLIADNELYLKVDDHNRSDFEELGLGPFTYNKNGKLMNLSYYQAPEEAMESLELMSRWGANAYECALRAAASKKRTKAPRQKR
ncbi:MAG: TfoX/Sxy family protein [Gammaproteobacteria bacterium]